jgi:hypothetical protein
MRRPIRVVVTMIKRMEEEASKILQILVDQVASIRLIKSMQVCICLLLLLKAIEVIITLVIFSRFKLICNGQKPRVCKCW